MEISVINVKTSEEACKVMLTNDDTVETLKMKIAEATGEPENDIMLRFGGAPLTDIAKVRGSGYVQADFKSTMNINETAGGARRRSRRGRKASRKSRKASRKGPRKASRKSRKASRKNRRNH